MPNPKKQEEQEQAHKHIWKFKNEKEKICVTLYENRPCIKLQIGQGEYDRRSNEWEAYFKLCQETPSKRDYEEIRIAYKAKDKEKMAEIKKRVNVRTRRSTELNEWGELGYDFTNSEFFASPPTFPYPEHPNLPYVILSS